MTNKDSRALALGEIISAAICDCSAADELSLSQIRVVSQHVAEALTDRLQSSRNEVLEENRSLREALELFCPGSEEMEKALWGEFPDEQTGTITFRMGALRRAREILRRFKHTPPERATPRPPSQESGK